MHKNNHERDWISDIKYVIPQSSYLTPFRLVFDVVSWSDFGFDILQVWQWLVNKSKLLGSSWGLWRGANDGDFLLTRHQDGRFWGSRCMRGPRIAGGSRCAWGTWRVAWGSARSDRSGSRSGRGWGATLSCSANWFWPYVNNQVTHMHTRTHEKGRKENHTLALESSLQGTPLPTYSTHKVLYSNAFRTLSKTTIMLKEVRSSFLLFGFISWWYFRIYVSIQIKNLYFSYLVS